MQIVADLIQSLAERLEPLAALIQSTADWLFVPVLVIVLLAFAFLEEDGVLLCIALAAALASLAITAAAVWGAVEVAATL